MSDRVNSRDKLTQSFVRECFVYESGRLIWRNRPVEHFADQWRQRIFNKRQAGTEAGSLTSGYIMVRFSFGKVGVHRIVFLYHHGYMPPEVDHINGDPADNRIENLRAATHAQNLRNVGLSRANTSGVRGVSFHKRTGKWVAHIRVNGRMKHLGLFGSLDQAAEARRSAEASHYEGFSRG